MVAKPTSKKTSKYRSLNLHQLTMGVKLQAPIYDGGRDNNILLLASGKTITKGTIENLKKRGISSVRVHQRDLFNLTSNNKEINASRDSVDKKSDQNNSPLQTDSAVSENKERDFPQSDSPWQIETSSFLHEIKPLQTTHYSPGMKSEYEKQFAGLTKITDGIYRQLLLSTNVSMPQINDITNISFSQMAQDIDLFALEGISPIENGDICRHSLQMSSLAMAIGTQLGLNRKNLIQLSTGCLLHDTGMNKIDHKTLWNNESLSPLEFIELQKHPSITFDILSKIHEIPMISKIIAYQVHERCDGSGYPRKQKGYQIHPLAKIASVADAFLTLVSARTGKTALTPYQAAEKMIYSASQGKFDCNAVRALLQSISLYPLGSYVELNNGQRATVIRTNRTQYDMPIVEIVENNGTSQIINLLDENLHVVRALSEAEAIPALSGA